MSGVLAGRAVIVTGAGKGLGRAYAEHAAAAGAHVVVNDVDIKAAQEVVDAIRAAGSEAVVDGHDVSDPDGAAALVTACLSAFGAVDGLVNNAGVFYESPLWEADPARTRRLVEINVLGTMYCTAQAVRVMKDRPGAAIVIAGSISAHGGKLSQAYSSSKGALTSFAYSAAIDLEMYGIRVNTIWPAALTPMVIDMVAESARPDVKGLDRVSPNRSMPIDVAPLVTYLLSPLAEGVTGQTFHFNGKTLGLIVLVPQAHGPQHTRSAWDVTQVAEALDGGALASALQPYGQQAILPPRAR